MQPFIHHPIQNLVLPALGAIALMLLAGCASDQNAPASTSTTTTTEETSSSAMPTPQPPAATTTQTTETQTVAPQ